MWSSFCEVFEEPVDLEKEEVLKMINYQEKFEELSVKYEAEKAEYNTKVTRKACLIVGIVGFVLGFLAKAIVF